MNIEMYGLMSEESKRFRSSNAIGDIKEDEYDQDVLGEDQN